MQFKLSTRTHDATMIAAALRTLDPEVQVTLDARRGNLEVLSSATGPQVLAVLETIGCPADALEKDVHISGGSTCCGHCA